MQIMQSANILNWYPFEKNNKILEIGFDNLELTKVLCDSCKDLTIVDSTIENSENLDKIENLNIINEKINKLNLNDKYDFIIIIGLEEKLKKFDCINLKLSNIISKLEKYLLPNGKFLIAVDNKFGLRFFSGDPENIFNKKFASLNGYNNEPQKVETFTRSKLNEIFENSGYKTFFYYPLPDYKLPNVIFSDNQLPDYTNVDKYFPYHTEKSDLLINEIDVFREILKTDENMFTFFTNSFLIEASKQDIECKYKYISFNNLRKKQYQLITKITDDYAEKQVISNESKEHYQNIINNLQILNESGIKTVDYVENSVIKSKYIEHKYFLENALLEKLENGNKYEFYKLIDDYINKISIGCYQEKDNKKTVFYKYQISIDEELLSKLHFLKKGLWDMTFSNCFYIDNEFVFFDQEWEEDNLPYEYILYRSILYTISLRRFININEIFEKYHLTAFLEIFKNLDDKIQQNIRDEEVNKFYSKNYFFNIDETKQEVINLNIRLQAQEMAKEGLKSENDEFKNEIVNIQQENEELKKENSELKAEKENITKEYLEYRNIQEKKLSNRIKRKLKKILKR